MVVVEMAPWQPDCRSALVDRLSPHKEGNAEEAVVSIIRGQCQKKQVFRSWQGGQDWFKQKKEMLPMQSMKKLISDNSDMSV